MLSRLKKKHVLFECRQSIYVLNKTYNRLNQSDDLCVEVLCEAGDCHILSCSVLMPDLLIAKNTGALISAYKVSHG